MKRVICVLFLGIVLILPAMTQGPNLLNYQGKLAEEGVPVSGTHQVTFSMYDAASGGTALWSEVHSVVVENGIFNVLLGSVQSFSANLFSGSGDRYLGIKIGTNAEMAPRFRLASVAYCMVASDVADNAVTTAKIADNAITGTKIADGTIGAVDLANNAVITAKIQDAAVTQAKLAADISLPISGTAGGDLTGTYPNPTIAAGKVTDTKIATNAVIAAKIASGAVTEAKIATNAVTAAKIASGAVSTAKIQDAAVTQAKLAADISLPISGTAGGDLTGTYPNPTIAAGKVTDTKIATNAVIAAKIASSAVTEAKIANNAVTDAKIASSAVTEAKIANNAVTDAKIASNAVTTTKIAPDAVTSTRVSFPFSRAVSITGTAFSIRNSGTGFAISATSGTAEGTAIIAAGNNVTPWYFTGGSGAAFTGSRYGIYVRSLNTSGDRAAGYFVWNEGVVRVAANVGGIARKIVGSGTVSTVMDTRLGKQTLYAPESPEPWFEDIGSGQLINGYAFIELDPIFLDCITYDEANPIRVFIQLTGDNENGVYVLRRPPNGFEVIELNRGNGNVTFDYRVIGKWRGLEDVRFGPAYETTNEPMESMIEIQ